MGWISVETKLPKSNVHVLCCTNWGEIIISSYQKDRWAGFKAYKHKILYWQPLPKVPSSLKKKLKEEIGFTLRERDPLEP